MKTIYPIGKPSIYAVIGLLAFTAVSCGSYQNSSYYDSDGIYGDDKKRSETVSETQSTNSYKQYFSTLKQDAILTDVDNYSSVPDSSASRAVVYDSHPGWGSQSENVTVNVYTNAWGYNYWPHYWYGPGWGWGFNSWYGPSWSIGWNNWYGGFGWGGYYPYYAGFYSPYYYGNGWYNGYNGNSYAYHPGRRGSSYTTGVGNGRSYYNGTRTSMSQSSNGVRTQPGTRTFSTRANSAVRSESTTGTPRSNYNTPRTGSVRQSSSPAPTRSYSPSYSGGRSSGGSYGGGGGSRSGGGRR